MAIVTSDFLAALFTNFSALWADQFLAASEKNKIIQTIAMEIPSTTDTESYNWLGTVPKMREWTNERQLSGLTSHNYSVQNKHYEASLEVDRDTLQDDKYQLIRPRIVQLAQEAARFPTELAIAKLIEGNTAAGLCYDGQQFFDTDHVDPGAEFTTAQSNKLTGTLTGAGTLAEIRTDYEAARAAMRNFKDGNGRPMNIEPTHVLCPPSQEGQFRQLLNSEFFNAGSVAAAVSNVWRGTAELIVSPYLTDTDDWYLLALDQPVKPLIYQNRQAPEFVALDAPTGDVAFMRKKFMYGVDSRLAIGFGLWQMAILSTNT